MDCTQYDCTNCRYRDVCDTRPDLDCIQEEIDEEED